MNPFFKRLLEHALFTFITLVIFFLCVMASIKAWDLFGDRPAYSPINEDYEYFYSHDELAKDLQLHSIQTEPNTDQLTITGRVQNSSTNTWRGVNLDVIYYVEEIEMGRCGYAGAEDLAPGKTYHFSSTCPIAANKLPSQFSYKVFFSGGQRMKPETSQNGKNSL